MPGPVLTPRRRRISPGVVLTRHTVRAHRIAIGHRAATMAATRRATTTMIRSSLLSRREARVETFPPRAFTYSTTLRLREPPLENSRLGLGHFLSDV
eukprot:2201835-Prymnesium_polylepis.1